MKIQELLETASAGATGAGSVATVSNPPASKGKKARQLGLPTKQGSLFGTVQKRGKP
jgi:hypothetical protein